MTSFLFPPFERDSRANTLKAYEFGGEVDGVPTWVDLCGPDEASRQLEVAYPGAVRRVDVPVEKRTDWTHRLVFSGPPPADFADLLTFLQSWLTLTRTRYLDFVIAAQWYKIPEDGVDPYRWENTPVGKLVQAAKYRGATPSEVAQAAARLGGGLAELAHRHPLYRSANSIVSIPGHNADGQSFGERVAAVVAQQRGFRLVQAGCTLGQRTSAKQSDSSELMGTITIPSTLHGTAVIVDDVYHTGGSIRATAYAVRQAGAQTVLGIVGARTLRN